MVPGLNGREEELRSGLLIDGQGSGRGHRADDYELYDQNFAIHFPISHKVLGRYHHPGDAWPGRVGLEDEPFPKDYTHQLVHPHVHCPKTTEGADRSDR